MNQQPVRTPIQRYFDSAIKTSTYGRHIGVEIETLAVDACNRLPISIVQSQRIIQTLIAQYEWKPIAVFQGVCGAICKHDFIVNYDLGANLFELNTPPVPMREANALLRDIYARQGELYSCMRRCGSEPLFEHHDGHSSHTLIESTPMDRLYWQLNGPALGYLAHIAAVHISIDLQSIEEGMDWIGRLEAHWRNKGWPLPESQSHWKKFVEESWAMHELARYGSPPLEWDRYMDLLASLKAYFKADLDGVFLLQPPQPLYEVPDADLELFVSYVWWWTRLRVRNSKLVLELRAIPRGNDEDLLSALEDIRSLLQL
jgi:hypothetical protein